RGRECGGSLGVVYRKSPGARRVLSRLAVDHEPSADQADSAQSAPDSEGPAFRPAAGEDLACTALAPCPDPPGEHDAGADRNGLCKGLPEGKRAHPGAPAFVEGARGRAGAGVDADTQRDRCHRGEVGVKAPKGGEGVRSLVKAMTSPGSRLIT